MLETTRGEGAFQISIVNLLALSLRIQVLSRIQLGLKALPRLTSSLNMNEGGFGSFTLMQSLKGFRLSEITSFIIVHRSPINRVIRRIKSKHV